MTWRHGYPGDKRLTLKDTIRAFGISLINRHLVQSRCICLKVVRDCGVLEPEANSETQSWSATDIISEICVQWSWFRRQKLQQRLPVDSNAIRQFDVPFHPVSSAQFPVIWTHGGSCWRGGLWSLQSRWVYVYISFATRCLQIITVCLWINLSSF